jgi:hypothetical protein
MLPRLAPAVKSLDDPNCILNNIFTKIDADNVGYEKAIIFKDSGRLAECTGGKAFWGFPRRAAYAQAGQQRTVSMLFAGRR